MAVAMARDADADADEVVAMGLNNVPPTAPAVPSPVSTGAAENVGTRNRELELEVVSSAIGEKRGVS